MRTGIANPDKPGQWIVPPWAADASFHELVTHFLRFYPWSNDNTGQLLAFYRGYLSALDSAAPPDENACPSYVRWRKDLRKSIDRCVVLYEEKILNGGKHER